MMATGQGRAQRLAGASGGVAALALLTACMVPPVETASDYPPPRDTVGVPGYAPAPQPAYAPADSLDDYYWIDTADGLAQAIGSAPPDFAFRFDGRDAYAWVSSAGEAMIVESSPYGVIQYYYAPRAAAPYLVRDVYESYAFDGPDFVAWFDGEGTLMRDTPSHRSQDNADRLHRRGREIMAASYQRRWDGDAATGYSSQSFIGFTFGAYDSGWSGGWRPRWRERDGWREVRRRRSERGAHRDETRGLDGERMRRAEAAQRFDGWRRGGRRGAPPVAGGGSVTPGAPPMPGTVSPAPRGAGRPVPPPAAVTPAPVVRQPVPTAVPSAAPPVRRAGRDATVGGFQPAPEVIEATPAADPAAVEREAEQRRIEERAERAAAAAAVDAIAAEEARRAEEAAEDARLREIAEERAIHLEAEREAREYEEQQNAARRAAEAAQIAANERAERERAVAAERQAQIAAEMAAQAAADRAEREAAEQQARAEARARAQAQAAAQAEAQARVEAAAEEREVARQRARTAEPENSAERPE